MDASFRTNPYHLPLWGLFFIAVMCVLALSKALFLPILLALLLSLMLSPIVRWFRRRGLPEFVTAGILVLMGGIAFGFSVLFLAEPFSNWIEQFPSQFLEVKRKLSLLFENMAMLQEASDTVSQTTSNNNLTPAVAAPSESNNLIFLAASNIFSIATTTLVTAVLSFFLLAKGRLFYTKVLARFSTLQDKKEVLSTVYSIERSISLYLLTITIINILLGISIAAAMWALGMPNPLLWGIAATFLNFLPYIGALMGVIGSGVVSVLVFDDLGFALLVPLVYGLLTIVEGQFVTPSYVGKRLSINPVIIFVSVAVWSFMWGLAGALIAVPLLVMVYTISSNVEHLSWFAHFVSDHED